MVKGSKSGHIVILYDLSLSETNEILHESQGKVMINCKDKRSSSAEK